MSLIAEGFFVTLDTVWVGARVYSYSCAKWGTVTSLTPLEYFTIHVKTDEGVALSCLSCGARFKFDSNPDLFWGVPTITAPPRPPRKVKKTLWQNVYRSGSNPQGLYSGSMHASEEAAKSSVHSSINYVATVRFEVEVDE